MRVASALIQRGRTSAILLLAGATSSLRWDRVRVWSVYSWGCEQPAGSASSFRRPWHRKGERSRHGTDDAAMGHDPGGGRRGVSGVVPESHRFWREDLAVVRSAMPTTMLKPSDRLRETSMPVWKQIIVHPYIQELKAGTLPTDTFRFYVQQDWLYLQEFART